MYNLININQLVSQLEEARNTLTYTLHLPYEPAVLKTILADKNYHDKMDIIIQYIHQACSCLFISEFNEKESTPSQCTSVNSSPDKLKKWIDEPISKKWLFFGDEYFDISEKQHPPGPLSILGSPRFYAVWNAMLIHHCFLATYDKLYNMIFQNIEVDAYKVSRHFNCWGVNYSLKKGGYLIDANPVNKFIFNQGKRKTSYGVVDSNTASNNAFNNYPSSFISLKTLFSSYSKYKKISDQIKLSKNSKEVPEKISNQKTKNEKCKDISFSLNNLPLLQQLRGRGKELTNILKLYDGQKSIIPDDISKFMKSVSHIQCEPIKLTDDWEENPMTPIDILYYKYKLEQTFNFDLVHCISKNITSFDQRLNQRMHDDSTLIDVITSIVNFPNVFSRPLLVQMAFDSCSDHRQLDSSFLTKRITSPDSMLDINKRSIRKTDSHNFFNQWKDCYNNFVDYMSELVFPIYESYFFVILYDVFSNSQESAAQNVLKLYHQLSDYLSTDTVFSTINEDYYRNEIMRIYNFDRGKNKALNGEDFISYGYGNEEGPPQSFSKVALSTYNHIPESMPPLISRQYLYENFKRTKESLLVSCTASLLR